MAEPPAQSPSGRRTLEYGSMTPKQQETLNVNRLPAVNTGVEQVSRSPPAHRE